MPAIIVGVWKMPAPMTMPTVIIVASQTLNVGAGTPRGELASDLSSGAESSMAIDISEWRPWRMKML
jgi:hypothetical protein